MTFADRLTAHAGGARIALKREDLLHTGAHKINNALGQVLLARRMGKTRVVAETGAGQHGVATATAAALLGLQCLVYMGAVDMERQAPNVFAHAASRRRGRPVDAGTRTLKDAINEALRDWVAQRARRRTTFSARPLGPHPYPPMVREFQAVIGREARAQCCERGAGCRTRSWPAWAEVRTPSASSRPTFPRERGSSAWRREAAARVREPRGPLLRRIVGVLHGTRTMLLQDEAGQVLPTHSVSAGLDYPAVGPEHAQLRDLERVEYTCVSDEAALDAFEVLSSTEGIIPALESAHAVAYVFEVAGNEGFRADDLILVNLSGRGDKDVHVVAALAGRTEP